MSWKVLLVGTDRNNISSSWAQGTSVLETPEDFVEYIDGLSLSLIGYSGILDRPILDVEDSAGDIVLTVESSDAWSSIPSIPFSGSIVRIVGNSDPSYFSFLNDKIFEITQVSGVTFKLREVINNEYNQHTFVIIDNYGVKPFYMDESESYTFYGGGYKKIKSGRLAFQFTPKPFRTQGDAGQVQTNKTYWDLVNTLKRRNLYILEFGAEFERINELLERESLSRPLLVEIYSLNELSDNFASNNSSLDMTIVTRELF